MQSLILAILILLVRVVCGAYFTMRSIETTLPRDKIKLPPGNHPLATLYAQSDPNGRHLKYSMNDTNGYLQIHPVTGSILLTNKFFESNLTAVDRILETVSAEDSGGKRDWTTFTLNIFPSDYFECDNISEDLCYWKSVNYQVKESQKATLLGTLTSPYITEKCSTYAGNYSLETENSGFRLVRPSANVPFWSLATSRPLDRDHQSLLNIVCTLEGPYGTKEIKKNVFVEILDINNHVAVPQNSEIIVNMDSNFIKQGTVLTHTGIIFTDKDSPSVNKYEMKVTSDDKAIDCNLLKPNCNTTFAPSHSKWKNHTVIHCKLIFTENTQIVNATTHTVVLQVNDTTLENANASTSVARLRIHLNFPNSSLKLKKTFNRSLILYPQREVKVFRTAAPYARLTEPKHCMDCSNFSINSTDNRGVFGVTEKGEKRGTVFVQNVTKLRTAFEYVRLNISWMEERRLKYDEIVVRIVGDSSTNCAHMTDNRNDWDLCSEANTYSGCIKPSLCGLSTGGSASLIHRKDGERCMWRGKKYPDNSSSSWYSTCTPDSSTCPDGLCDSLEQLDYRICPQDCTESVDFPTQKNQKTNLGVDEAAGVVTCNRLGHCASHLVKPRAKEPKEPKDKKKVDEPNVSRHMRNVTESGRILGIELSKCGTSCILGILGGTLFLVGAVALIVVCWRLDRVNKSVQGKYNDDSQDMVAPLSDYVDRNVNAEAFPLNFHMTTNFLDNSTFNIIKKYEPDPKWEFPRSQLIIEQTLGEGEFGRVLRAKALDIAAQQGYTTVAVKTLKDDAREAELNDLLSEYQLLREVSHPNVIRLLGVCTAPGGPIYLIIEFAEHGSLRNYLRRSRHLKSDCVRLPASSEAIDDGGAELQHYDEPIVAQVSPKEVLSFAWQICNGMAYLSDIKLVHRDLAARNVLLAVDKICKISDFGLTRDIYEDNAYFKRSKGRVPVKWMAPESLADHIYTSKSDVWSFGILVWELVTLGATPYPGIAVQNLFHLLRQGYRMERPDNCSSALYKIMRKCWHWEAEKRPTFQQLATEWEQMLADGTEYLDLTNNAIHNRSYFCSPFEELNEDDFKMEMDGSLNYMSKSVSHEKCGATEKQIESNESDAKVRMTDNNQNINTQGYETPVKVQKKLQTPTNEWPQEYTDMEAGRMK